MFKEVKVQHNQPCFFHLPTISNTHPLIHTPSHTHTHTLTHTLTPTLTRAHNAPHIACKYITTRAALR